MATTIIGSSPAFCSALEEARMLSVCDDPIVIKGETGTGKELFAAYIHEYSRRCNKGLIRVNTAGFEDNFFDSEMFGYEAHAFTGAATRKIGRFEEAGEGTIFLDEIGDLSPNAQIKLLRILENRQFRRIGGTTDREFKARVITATNVNLKKRIQTDGFREDLANRLGFPIVLPPLRERQDDIPELVKYFLDGVVKENINRGEVIPPWYSDLYEEYVGSLLYTYPYHWPGNVRELKHVARYIYFTCINGHHSEDGFTDRVKAQLVKVCVVDKPIPDQLMEMISGLVRSYLSSFAGSGRSLHQVLNGIMQQGVCKGLHLAVVNDGYAPRSRRELGMALGIPNLIHGSRTTLPKGEDDYMVNALKSLTPQCNYPEKLREILDSCYKDEGGWKFPQRVAEDHPLGEFFWAKNKNPSA